MATAGFARVGASGMGLEDDLRLLEHSLRRPEGQVRSGPVMKARPTARRRKQDGRRGDFLRGVPTRPIGFRVPSPRGFRATCFLGESIRVVGRAGGPTACDEDARGPPPGRRARVSPDGRRLPRGASLAREKSAGRRCAESPRAMEDDAPPSVHRGNVAASRDQGTIRAGHVGRAILAGRNGSMSATWLLAGFHEDTGCVHDDGRGRGCGRERFAHGRLVGRPFEPARSSRPAGNIGPDDRRTSTSKRRRKALPIPLAAPVKKRGLLLFEGHCISFPRGLTVPPPCPGDRCAPPSEARTGRCRPVGRFP